MCQRVSVVGIIRKLGLSARGSIHHPQAQSLGYIALKPRFEGSPIRSCGGGIRHCCMIAAAQTRLLHYSVDYYLCCHHCSFLFSCHLWRKKILDVSVPLLVVVEEELVTGRMVDLEQQGQQPGRQI